MNKGNIRNLRNKALVGAIVAALAFGTAGAASAASPVYTFDGTGQELSLQQYLQSLANQQVLTGAVQADALNNEFGYRGPADGGNLTVDGNVIQALTLDAGTGLLGANGADNSVDLGLLGTQDPALTAGDPNQGIGILSGQLAFAGASTLVKNAGIGLDIADYTAGNAVVTDNALGATTVANNAGNRVTGSLDTSFGSTADGHAGLHYDPSGASESATGGVVIGNAQMTAGVDASARMSQSDIALVNAMSAQDSYSSAPVTVTGNAASTAATGNRGDNRFAAAAGEAVGYAGSVTLVNGQGNIGGSVRAVIVDTDIGAELDGTLYSGQADVSGNRLSAAAEGNDAAAVGADGSLVRGNAISFGPGIDVAGAGGAADLDLSFGGNVVDGAANGDLALLSSQGNQQSTIVGRIADSDVGVELTTLEGGSLTLTDNRADASAGGNDAINLVSAQGSSFDATVSAGNQQSNDRATVRALVQDLDFGARIEGGSVNDGDVTVTGNGIGATASGNSAQTLVDVQGTQFAAGSGAAAAGASNAGFTALHIDTAGISAGNLQANYGAGTRIEAAVDHVDVGAGYADSGIIDSNLSVSDNAVSASAGGNSARTSVAAGGTGGVLSAALASGQYNANDILASIVDSSTLISSDDDIQNSHLSVSDNVYSASAFANQAGNSVSTAFDSGLALGGGSGSGIDTAASTNNASAALVLLNDQINDGARVRASAENISIGASTFDDIYGSSVDLHANAIGASASGNIAGNSLTPDAGNLVRSGDGSLAALGNLQQMSGNTVAAVTDADIGVYADDYADGFTGALTGNRISAFAGGNLAGGAAGTAGNSLLVGGTNLVDADGTDTMSYVDPGANQGAQAAFILQNAQSSTTGSRNAEIEGADIADSLWEVSDNVLSVGDNSISAEARDNRAANTVSLSGFSNLSTTAALVNAQASAGGMNGSIDDASIGVSGDEVWNSDVAISDNAMSARAVANAASNLLAVDATQLGGAAGDGALPVGAPAGYRGAVLDGPVSFVVADYGLNSRQERSGDVHAGISDADIGVEAWDIDGDSSATVTGNAMTAFGQGNSAGNTLSLSGSGIDATAAILGEQSMHSDVVASVSGAGIGITTGEDMDSAMPLTVTGNSAAAIASLNGATNALSASADASVAGSVGLAGASNDSTNYAGFVGAVGDFAVANFQYADGSAQATLQDVQTGIRADGDIGAASGDSSLTVSGNQLAAEASGNSADNSVALNGGSNVNATAALHNQQIMAGDAISAAASNVSIAAGNEGVGDIDRAALTVADNRVSGAASGNSASNAITVASAALNGPGAAGIQSGASSAGGTSTAIADYALNSIQANQTAISSTVSGVGIGVNVGGSTGAVNGGTATIGRNAVLASASGNTAGNSIMLASVAGSTASAALTNTQTNTASVIASIQDAHVGMHAGTGSSLPVTVTGNTISASATGNSAVNHIGIGK